MRLFRFLVCLNLIVTAHVGAGQVGNPELTEEIVSAIRVGNIPHAWDNFMAGVVNDWDNADVIDKLLLLEKGIEICLIENNPRLALEICQVGKDQGLWEQTDWYIRGHSMEAWLYFILKEYDMMNAALVKVQSGLSEETGDLELSIYFSLKALYAWITHQHDAAIEFIETVLFHSDSEEIVQQPRALSLLVLAAALEEHGIEDSLISSNLELSRKLMENDMGAIVFQSCLATLLQLHPGQSIRSVNAVLLEFASRSERYNSNWLASVGISARAELIRREGDLEKSVDYLQRSQARLLKWNETVERQNRDWERVSIVVRSYNQSGGKLFSTYLVILTMLLVILVLVMLLRIRTQRVVNQRLVESVEKSRIAELAAEHASRLKSQFVANVSHEIKTPMSGLVGMTSLLEELIADPIQRKYLSTIRICSKNLLVILNDLLDLGRIEANKLEIEKKPFLLSETLKYCEQVVMINALEKKLKLIVETNRALPETIIGDSTRISQIIVNLLNNAIKFTEEGTVRMEVDFEKTIGDSGRLMVYVQDTGLGIEPDRLQTVFEPFNQKAPTNGTSMTGSGLGLAICKRLTDHMGGTLTVKSEHGKGSLFSLSLPVRLSE